MAAPGKVCVVDDEPAVRRGLDRLLTAAGFEVVVFSSGQDFLAAVPSDAPACLILDYQMPGLSGLELRAVLAARGFHAPIVFLSGRSDIVPYARAVLGSEVEFLLKPASRDDIIAAVERAIERWPTCRKRAGLPGPGS
jgi:FixJ family two-component response regulator